MSKKYLIFNDIDKILSDSINELSGISEDLQSCGSSALLKGGFVYAYAILDETLVELNEYIIACFPRRSSKKYEIPFEELFDLSSDKYLRSEAERQATGSLIDAIKFVLQKKSEDFGGDANLIYIEEIQQMRNRLVHGKLKLNESFLSFFRKNKKQTLLYHLFQDRAINESQGSINFDNELVLKYVSSMVDCLEYLLEELNQKYSGCTQKKAIEEFWGEFFKTPIFHCKDIVKFKENGTLNYLDVIHIKDIFDALSSTEQMMAELIVNKYNHHPLMNERQYSSLLSEVLSTSSSRGALINDLIDTLAKNPGLLRVEDC